MNSTAETWIWSPRGRSMPAAVAASWAISATLASIGGVAGLVAKTGRKARPIDQNGQEHLVHHVSIAYGRHRLRRHFVVRDVLPPLLFVVGILAAGRIDLLIGQILLHGRRRLPIQALRRLLFANGANRPLDTGIRVIDRLVGLSLVGAELGRDADFESCPDPDRASAPC